MSGTERASSPAATGGGGAAWERMFRVLAQFKAVHGHMRVPRSREHAALGAWLSLQNELHQKGKLPAARQRVLQELGVEWEVEDEEAARRRKRPLRENLWQTRLAEYVAFMREHGHQHMTRKNAPVLMAWQHRQRINHSNGKLTPERQAALEAIGFEWVVPGRLAAKREVHDEAIWERSLAQLLAFRDRHGHCRVPMDSAEDASLGGWVHRQRVRQRRGRLRQDRHDRLEQAGFVWEATGIHREVEWEERLAQLAAFHREHGHLKVTRRNESVSGLYNWQINLRRLRRLGRLTADQIAQLDAMGFDWSEPMHDRRTLKGAALWELDYKGLVAFKQRHGHTHPPAHGRYLRLYRWCKEQRAAHEAGTLPPAQVARLEALGFTWASRHEARLARLEDHWQARCDELAAFRARHGHCRPSAKIPAEKALGLWVQAQRVALRAGRLSAGRLARLEALDWEAGRRTPPDRRAMVAQARAQRSAAIWDARYNELATFRQTHGHTRVPADQEHGGLYRWTRNQRIDKRTGTLRPEYQARLDALGFEWQPVKQAGVWYDAASWERFFQQLRAFQQRTGHTRVPAHHGQESRLGAWVARQRRYHRRGHMRAEQKRRLDEIGFEWRPPSGRGVPAGRVRPESATWQARVAELLAFHAQYGHWYVPSDFPPNPALGIWISNIRSRKKSGRLPAASIARLDALGFEWEGVNWRAARREAGKP